MAKVALRLVCAKQSKNLEKYLMHRVQGCYKESIVLGFVARGTKRCMLSPLETEAVVGTFCKVCKHIHEVSGTFINSLFN